MKIFKIFEMHRWEFSKFLKRPIWEFSKNLGVYMEIFKKIGGPWAKALWLLLCTASTNELSPIYQFQVMTHSKSIQIINS